MIIKFFSLNALFYDVIHLPLSPSKLHRPYTRILFMIIVFRLSYTCQFVFCKISWTRNEHKLISSVSLGFVFSSSFLATFRTVFADADPTLSNDSAKIRSGNGANPTPGHERTLPASLQDALSISVPQRRLTPFPARDGISLLNRIKTIRELPASRGCSARASERLLYAPLCLQSHRFSLTI